VPLHELRRLSADHARRDGLEHRGRARRRARLKLTITASGLTPERIEFKIRDGARPVAKLL
jgi:hypothetical protein